MSSIVYLKNRSTGKVYAYLNESVWNSELKKCECKRKCLGHVDPVTGEIVPNRGNSKKEYATVRSIGHMFFFNNVAENIGLTYAMKQAFPDNWKLLLSCIFFNLSEQSEMSRIKNWSIDCDTPYNKPISNEVLSEALGDITENNLFIFFREWRDRFDDDFYAIHTSSISSYDNREETIRFNDLPLVIVNPTTYLTMVYSVKSNIPITYGLYSRMPVNITDIRRREHEKSWLDINKTLEVLDTDYFSEDNLNDLLSTNHRFIMRVSPETKFARDAIDRVKDKIMDLKNYMMVENEPFFVMSFMNHINGKRCFIHIIFSSSDAEREFSLFLGLIEECHKELKTNVYVAEHEDFYNKYFTVRNASYGRVVEENGEAIMTYNTVAGFIVMISNTVKNPENAFRYYLQRDRVQRNFENLRNEADRTKLKLYAENIYEGRIFIQFATLTLYSEIMNKLKSSALLTNISLDDIIRQMEAIKKITIPGFDTPFFTNINNTQMKIMKVFGIDPDKMKEL